MKKTRVLLYSFCFFALPLNVAVGDERGNRHGASLSEALTPSPSPESISISNEQEDPQLTADASDEQKVEAVTVAMLTDFRKEGGLTREWEAELKRLEGIANPRQREEIRAGLLRLGDLTRSEMLDAKSLTAVIRDSKGNFIGGGLTKEGYLNGLQAAESAVLKGRASPGPDLAKDMGRARGTPGNGAPSGWTLTGDPNAPRAAFVDSTNPKGTVFETDYPTHYQNIVDKSAKGAATPREIGDGVSLLSTKNAKGSYLSYSATSAKQGPV